MENRDADYGLPNPEDEYSARLDMREKLTAEYGGAEIDAFFDKTLFPAFKKFRTSFFEIVGDDDKTSLRVEVDASNFRRYERWTPEYYIGRTPLGVKVTKNDEWVFFYYYVYAMTPPNKPLGLCVFTKTNGKYKILHDINTRTIDDLFEDVKKAFNAAKAQMTEG
jgi:hypothetical protein